MMLILLLAAALVCLAGAAGVALRRPAWVAPVRWAPLLAAALVVVALALTAPRAPDGPYGQSWLTLRAMSLALPPEGRLSLGGDPEQDDVVLSPGSGAAALRVGRGRLPAGFLTMTGASGGVILTLQPQSGPGSRAVVRVRDKDGERFLGAAPAPAGAKPCLDACGAAAPKLDRVRAGAVYTVGEFPVLAPGGPLEPAGGYLFSPPGQRRLWAAGAPGAASTLRIAEGGAARITIFEAEASTGARGGEPPMRGRLILRRGFDLAFAHGRLTVTPETPQTEAMDLDRGAAGRPAVRIASGAAAGEPAQAGEALAAFSLLGRRFDPDLARYRLDVARDSAEPSILHEPGDRERAIRGRAELGGERAVSLDVRPLDFRSGVYPFLWPFALAAFACALGAGWRLRREDNLAALVLGALELMLALRLVVAVEGAFVDASVKAQSAVAAALIAIPLASCVVLLAHPRAREHRLGAALLAVVTLAAVALTGAALGRMVDVGWLALGLIPLAGAAAWFGWPQRLAALYEHTRAWPVRVALFGALVVLLLRAALGAVGVREGINLGFTRLALSLVFVPVTLALFAPLIAQAARGWKPASSDRPADPLRRLWARLGPARIAALTLGLALVLGVALPSKLVNDNGFAIFAVPVLVAAVVAASASAGARARGLDWAAAVLVVAPVLLGLLLWTMGLPAGVVVALLAVSIALGGMTLWRRPAGLWLAPAAAAAGLLLLVNLVAAVGGPGGAALDIAQAVQAKDNDLRLMAVLDPARLAEVGTRGADALQDTVDHMRAYGDTLLGRGYFTLPAPTVLKPYHLTDNVSAVHLISPFGRLGALAFLLIPGSMAAAACAVALRRGSTPAAWLGALAALTLSLVSTYMVLANLLAAPFTGRNVYLLAAASSGDLLEGTVLFVLVLALLGAARPEERA